MDVGGDRPPTESLPSGRLVIRRLRFSSGGSIPILVAWFAAPRTYTGQDLAEIQCPGNPALLQRIVQRTIDCGARPAEGGEFTFRAFAAGKMDLTQAEGVAATISAVSDGQLRAARVLREGKLAGLAEQLVEQLGDLLALVEAGIDFTDQEDVVPIGPVALGEQLAAVGDQLATLLGRSRPWSALEALPRVVLAGAASTGKSTLFNALLGRCRAVIDEAPGTTRDVLAEPLTLHDRHGAALEMMLVDTAGLDTSHGPLDRRAHDSARRALQAADLVLHLDDGRRHGPFAVPDPPPTTAVLRVRSKADLPEPTAPDGAIRVSGLSGDGLEALRRAMLEKIHARTASVSSQMLALQPRHEAALRHARDHLERARNLVADQGTGTFLQNIELVAASLRAALDELAGLGGRLTADDVIGRVFSRFCVGK